MTKKRNKEEQDYDEIEDFKDKVWEERKAIKKGLKKGDIEW